MSDIRKFFVIEDSSIQSHKIISLSCGCCSESEYFFYDIEKGSIVEWDYDTDEIKVDGVEIEYEGIYPMWYKDSDVEDITP